MCTGKWAAWGAMPFTPPQTNKWLLVFVIPQILIGIALIVCQAMIGGLKHGSTNGYWVGGVTIGAGICGLIFAFQMKRYMVGATIGNGFSSLGGCIAVVVISTSEITEENWVGNIDPQDYKKFRDFTLVLLMLALFCIPLTLAIISYIFAGLCNKNCPQSNKTGDGQPQLNVIA